VLEQNRSLRQELQTANRDIDAANEHAAQRDRRHLERIQSLEDSLRHAQETSHMHALLEKEVRELQGERDRLLVENEAFQTTNRDMEQLRRRSEHQLDELRRQLLESEKSRKQLIDDAEHYQRALEERRRLSNGRLDDVAHIPRPSALAEEDPQDWKQRFAELQGAPRRTSMPDGPAGQPFHANGRHDWREKRLSELSRDPTLMEEVSSSAYPHPPSAAAEPGSAQSLAPRPSSSSAAPRTSSAGAGAGGAATEPLVRRKTLVDLTDELPGSGSTPRGRSATIDSSANALALEGGSGSASAAPPRRATAAAFNLV